MSVKNIFAIYGTLPSGVFCIRNSFIFYGNGNYCFHHVDFGEACWNKCSHICTVWGVTVTRVNQVLLHFPVHVYIGFFCHSFHTWNIHLDAAGKARPARHTPITIPIHARTRASFRSGRLESTSTHTHTPLCFNQVSQSHSDPKHAHRILPIRAAYPWYSPESKETEDVEGIIFYY